MVTSLLRLGYLNEAVEVREKALEASQNTHDGFGQAFCYCCVGYVYQSLGQLEKAVKNYETGRRIMKEVQHPCGEAAVLTRLGDVYVDLGQYDKSMECYKKARDIFEIFRFKEAQVYCFLSWNRCHIS